jgi:DNA-binding transcriptional regulator YiaG
MILTATSGTSGARIRQIRTQRGLTRIDLAAARAQAPQ